jgi:hypothetical protein
MTTELYLNVRLAPETKKALLELGKKGETYNDIVLRLIEGYKK